MDLATENDENGSSKDELLQHFSLPSFQKFLRFVLRVRQRALSVIYLNPVEIDTEYRQKDFLNSEQICRTPVLKPFSQYLKPSRSGPSCGRMAVTPTGNLLAMKHLPGSASAVRNPVYDFWSRTLAQIPSIVGRLVYLTSLRDPNTGRYIHHGLAHYYGENAAHEAIAQSHWYTFYEWINLTLEEQKTDLVLYLSGLEGDRKEILETWLRLAPYRNFIPAYAREAEKHLFLSDMETLLELLRNEYGLDAPDQDA